MLLQTLRCLRKMEIGVLLLIIGASVALAHEGQDPLAVWFRSLLTADGISYCSDRDCGIAEARMKDDHWEVWIQPYDTVVKWVKVPEEAIPRRENPDSRPILCRAPNGYIRCFVPPAGA